jgi:hypothetical protein
MNSNRLNSTDRTVPPVALGHSIDIPGRSYHFSIATILELTDSFYVNGHGGSDPLITATQPGLIASISTRKL